MDFITKRFESKLDCTDSSTPDKFTLLRARIEYVFYFLLGYIWNSQYKFNDIDDLKDFVECKGKNFTLGNILASLKKLDRQNKILTKNAYDDILQKYNNFRNENIGHGFIYTDRLAEFENFLSNLYDDLLNYIPILKEQYDTILVNKKDNDVYVGLIFKARDPERWSAPINSFPISISDLFPHTLIRPCSKEKEYNEISPFVRIDKEGEPSIFFQIEDPLSGKVKYTLLFKTGKDYLIYESSTVDLISLAFQSAMNEEYRKKSSINGTIMTQFTPNYKKYFEVGLSSTIREFIGENDSSVVAVLWGNGGVGKTACIQKMCEDLYSENTDLKEREFDYIVFVSAKDRCYNPVSGEICDIEDSNKTYYSIINTIHRTMTGNDLSCSENSDDFQKFVETIRNTTSVEKSRRTMLLVVDDFETFPDEEKKKIDKFVHTLDIKKHKVIITTRNVQLIDGIRIQVSNLTEEQTVSFLKIQIQENYPNFCKDFAQILKIEDGENRIYEATGKGIPILILQWQHLFVQKPSDDTLYKKLLETETAIEFMTGRVYDSLNKDPKLVYATISLVIDKSLQFSKSRLKEICKKYITTDDSFDEALRELEDLHIVEQLQENGFKSDAIYRVYMDSYVNDMKNKFENLEKSVRDSIKGSNAHIGNNSSNIFESLLIEARQSKSTGNDVLVESKYRQIIKKSDCNYAIRENAVKDLLIYYIMNKDNYAKAIDLFNEFKSDFLRSTLVMYNFIFYLWGSGTNENRKIAMETTKEYFQKIQSCGKENVRFYSLGIAYLVKYLADNKKNIPPSDRELGIQVSILLFEYLSNLHDNNEFHEVMKFKHDICVALLKIAQFFAKLSGSSPEYREKCIAVSKYFFKNYSNLPLYNKAMKDIVGPLCGEEPKKDAEPTLNIGAIVEFHYKSTLFDKYDESKIIGFTGFVEQNRALLHIKNISNNFVMQDNMQEFSEFLNNTGVIKVKVESITEKGVSVSLKDIHPNFEELLGND